MKVLQPLTLRRNFSWTFIGNVVYAACQWAIVVILAKLGSPEMLGQFTLGFAITAPVILLTNLQLRTVQVTDAKQTYCFSDYLGLRCITTGIALLIVLGIVLIVGYRWQTSLIILLVALAKAIESFSDVLYGLLQQHERMDRIAISMMIKGILSLAFLSLGLYLTGSIAWGVLGLAIAWAIVLISYDLQNGRSILRYAAAAIEPESVQALPLQVQLQPRWQMKPLLKLFWLAFPLGFVMMLISLNSDIPRYLIERFLGERELGIFAAIAYLMAIGNMLVSALAEAVTARLAKYYAAANRVAFRDLMLKLVGIGSLLGIASVGVALVAGKPLLALIYQPEYAEYSDLFVWLMIAAGFGYVASFLGYGMSAARYFRVQIPIFMAVTGISAIACVGLLPRFGLQGAALALVIGAVARMGISSGIMVYALHQLRKQANSYSEQWANN